jgi:hypothetical protein
MKDTLLPIALVITLVAGIWYYINVRAQQDASARAFSATLFGWSASMGAALKRLIRKARLPDFPEGNIAGGQSGRSRHLGGLTLP